MKSGLGLAMAVSMGTSCLHPPQNAAAPEATASWSVGDEEFVGASLRASLQECAAPVLRVLVSAGPPHTAFALDVWGDEGAAVVEAGTYPCSRGRVGVIVPRWGDTFRYPREMFTSDRDAFDAACTVTLEDDAFGAGLAHATFEGAAVDNDFTELAVFGELSNIPIAMPRTGPEGPCGAYAQ